MDVDPVIASVGPGWSDWMPGALAGLAGAPNTVIHGDYRADNILFDADGNVVLLDFQLTGRGSGSYDLAYFVTQSLRPEVAATHETALFNRWIDGLVSAGVPEAETVQLWDRYREAALFCLVYPIVAARGMDLADERQYTLLDNMNTRFVRAVDQLNLVDLCRDCGRPELTDHQVMADADKTALDAAQARYAAERTKRLRVDGNEQYSELAGMFADFDTDPYVEGFTRDPIVEETTAVIVGGGFAGMMTAVELKDSVCMTSA